MYSIMLNSGEKYTNELEYVFTKMQLPDKFNNHDLNVKCIKDYSKSKDKTKRINVFLEESQLAKRVVSKWFNRDKETGSFNCNLVAERGFYNASEMDVQLALSSYRGISMLADAGEELIGNTFLLVNDITYVDKEENAQFAMLIFSAIAAMAGGVGDVSGNKDVSDISDMVESISQLGGNVSNLIAGFQVKITSYLYQLDWNEEVESQFYTKYYFDSTSVNPQKKSDFEADRDLFKFKYLGSQTVVSDKTALRGVKTNEELIMKTLDRALDKSIVKLQREHEVFKVKVPISRVDENNVYVKIGLKEGVSEKSVYEVLERIETEEGKTEYRHVGTIKPIKDKIWDNRFMAMEEEAKDADLQETTFKIISGNGFYPGMLIREVR